jgi:predicted AAA+ superfamily ATPase
MEVLDQLYYSYRLSPYAGKLAHALRKERKLYLWDWSALEDPGVRFENVIAGHLLKFCHFLEDSEGYSLSLHYLRDKSKREVDFLVTNGGKPWFAVEAKLSAGRDRALSYFGERLKIPQLFYVSLEDRDPFEKDGVVFAPAARFLRALGI